MKNILISQVADELGIVKEYCLRLVKKYGFEIHYGKRNVASISEADANKLIREYEPRRKNGDLDEENDLSNDGFGFYYLIQLLPDELPNRVKIGYTDSINQRVVDHRTTNPTLKLVHTWPCKRIWEKAVEASVAREECTHIGGEVYDGDIQGFIDRANNFFALMPKNDGNSSNVDE